MTNGIIQQAFEKHTRELCKSEYFDEVMFTNYKCLERELIEKIKQEYTKEGSRFDTCQCWIDKNNLIDKLIGDNQE